MKKTPIQRSPFLLKLASAGAIVLLSACVSSTPQYDAVFGNSTRAAVAQQIANPEASQNTNPVNGVDGRAAQSTMDRYHKSFQQPEPQPNAFTIGIGGGSSGGGSYGSSVGK